MNWPSGEKRGRRSLAFVRATAIGLPAPPAGATQMSPRVAADSTQYVRNLPSDDQSPGTFCSSDVSSACSAAAPLTVFTKMSETPLRYDMNATFCPSGDQKGCQS